MPGGIFHGWLLARDSQGTAYEIINQARTAAYLANPDLAIDTVSICDVLEFGGCATYALGPDEVLVTGGYLDFPGTASEWVSIPSGAVSQSTGDMTVIATVALDDWSPSVKSTIVGRYHTTGNQRHRAFSVNTTGSLDWQWSTNGTDNPNQSSTANLSTRPAGAKVTVAVTFDADTIAGNHESRFWTAPDPDGPWTQLGATVTTGGGSSINGTSTSPVYLGSITGGISQILTGNIHYVSVRNGIGTGGAVGGTEIFRFDGSVDLNGYDVSKGPDQTFVTSSGDPALLNQFSTSPGLVVVPPQWGCDLLPLSFVEPATDPAPWYNSAYPDSADALGFYVEEWTGLDDGHVRRTNSPRGGPGGGSMLGVVGAEGRTMALNIMLFARTEAGMDYLFRWLSSTLNSICATCATSSMLIRRFCGDVLDPWHGVAELRQVGVVQGLKWESDIGKRARCFIRRASFTLMAGDPCMYLPETASVTSVDDFDADLETFFTTDNEVDDTRSTCRPSCSELSANARVSRTFDVQPAGAMAPVVTWTNNTDDYTFPFRAVVYFDPFAVGTDNPNPCGLQILGELYVRALPPSSAMRWDITGRGVWFRDSSTGGWTPSWTYVDANDPPYRRFFVLPCGTSHLVMEPASMCATTDDEATWTLDGVDYTPPLYPDVDVVLSERISCP